MTSFHKAKADMRKQTCLLDPPRRLRPATGSPFIKSPKVTNFFSPYAVVLGLSLSLPSTLQVTPREPV